MNREGISSFNPQITQIKKNKQIINKNINLLIITDFAYPLGSSYLLFLDSGSRSLRSLARNDGPKDIRQLHFILNLSEMDNYVILFC